MHGKSYMCKSLFKFEFLFFLLLLLTGCWDRTEVNDLALITASAYDLAPNGELQYTVQIMLPSSGGQSSGQGSSGTSQKKSFTIESAVGLDPGDAEKNIQKKFPRRLFRGHRRVIIIGEELARQGLDKMLDSIGRDPQNRLRTNVLVAKGKKGSELLKVDYPMERVPTEAMREMLVIGIGIQANIRELLIAACSEGTQPIAAAIEPGDGGDGKEGFKTTGIALFKGLKLAGYLNNDETDGYLWVTGKYKTGIVAAAVPENEGIIRINVKNAKAKITPQIKGNQVIINVKLYGTGSIFGNSTKLDLSLAENIMLAEEAIEEKIKSQVENTIKVVQKEHGTDIFGFGSTIYQRNPKAWKELSKNWDKTFSDAEVLVTMDFKIKTAGMSNPPLYLKEDEVKRK